MSQAHINDVSKACRILFGPGVLATPDFLGRLRPSLLKNTYHRRALEFHPDRAFLLGKDAALLNERFKDVNLAYECLRGYLSRRPEQRKKHSKPRRQDAGVKPHDHPPKSKAKAEDRRRSSVQDHFWQASIPDTNLLFGQFLYYAGVISWRTLIQALTWQRRQRPSFGRIATMWDYLDGQDLGVILAGRRAGERLGEAALRLGFLSPFQRNAVLGFQRWLQRPLGSYFTERGLLLEEEIDYLVRLMRRHNSCASRNRRFA